MREGSGAGGVGFEQIIVPSHWRSVRASFWHILILGVLKSTFKRILIK